jgi:hypothetical protein
MNKAFISFTALVLIAVFLIFAFLSLSYSAFYLFSGLNDERNFYQSKMILESCADLAIGKIMQNSNYAGNETINLENFNCYVYNVENLGGYKLIKIRTEYGNLRLYLQVIFDIANKSIIQWQILPLI